MALPDYREIAASAVKKFGVWGPCSGGGTDVILANGKVYEVVYGDMSGLPGGAEEVQHAWEPSDYAALFAADPRHAEMIAWVREVGLIGPAS